MRKGNRHWGDKPVVTWVGGRWEVAHISATDRMKLINTQVWAHIQNERLGLRHDDPWAEWQTWMKRPTRFGHAASTK